MTEQVKTTRQAILDKAEAIYRGNRDGQYGQRERNFEAIAALWTAYSGYELGPPTWRP